MNNTWEIDPSEYNPLKLTLVELKNFDKDKAIEKDNKLYEAEEIGYYELDKKNDEKKFYTNNIFEPEMSFVHGTTIYKLKELDYNEDMFSIYKNSYYIHMGILISFFGAFGAFISQIYRPNNPSKLLMGIFVICSLLTIVGFGLLFIPPFFLDKSIRNSIEYSKEYSELYTILVKKDTS